jgi:hypothetical protein
MSAIGRYFVNLKEYCTGRGLQIAGIYIAFHAIVALCTCFIGLEYLIGYRWVPVSLYIAVKLVAMLGSVPFVFLAPVAIVAMLRLTHKAREWLYLGLCEFGLALLQICAVVAASV